MLFKRFSIKRADKIRKQQQRRIRKTIQDAKVWYVDIPRTSSTSIKTELSQKFGAIYGKYYSREGQESQNLIEDHTPAIEMRQRMGSTAWKSIYSFSFVRNPWARFLSLYRYRISNNDLDQEISFETYVRSLETPRYNDAQNPFSIKPYHMSMIDYLTDLKGNIIVNDVFKLEDRKTAINVINQNLNLNIGQMHMEKISNHKEYQSAYTTDTKQIIAKFYADDIQSFGYEF